MLYCTVRVEGWCKILMEFYIGDKDNWFSKSKLCMGAYWRSDNICWLCGLCRNWRWKETGDKSWKMVLIYSKNKLLVFTGVGVSMLRLLARHPKWTILFWTVEKQNVVIDVLRYCQWTITIIIQASRDLVFLLLNSYRNKRA